MTSVTAPSRPTADQRWALAPVVATGAAVAAVCGWAVAVSQVFVDLRTEAVGTDWMPGPLYCGQAIFVWFNGPDVFVADHVGPGAQDEYIQACAAVSGERLLLTLGLLALAVALAGWAVHHWRSGTRHRWSAPVAGDLVSRAGALIGLFYFLGAITLAALFGYDAWWVNYKEVSAALGYGGIVAGALLLTLLPRYPQAAFLACGGLSFALYGLGVMLGLTTVLMALVALFGVTLWTTRRTGLWALSASLGSLAIAVVLLFVRYGFNLPPLETFLTDRVALFLFNSSGVVVLTWAVADQIRAARERRALQAQSASHAADAAAHQEAEQAARGEVQALADRQRIAREMHDIVAHGLSVMIVQADGARFAAAQDPAAATNALATIAATGRSSLAEMRRLLSVLRDDSVPVPEGPQPGLGDIASLVAALTDSGREVHLTVDGSLAAGDDDRDAAGLMGLTAYRIVQEALTNVMKHAGDEARVWVTVTSDDARVLVEVVDDGAGGAGGAAADGGHGLRGMRERVDMVGGQLVARPDPRGGWRVLATLPRAAGPPRVDTADVEADR